MYIYVNIFISCVLYIHNRAIDVYTSIAIVMTVDQSTDLIAHTVSVSAID